MKSVYNIWFLIACLILVSCYEEDPITPMPSESVGRFEFPQGDNSWDDDIVDIYNQYGVRLIYKDIIDKDFSKNWSGSSSSTYYGVGCINDEMTQFYITFMKDHIFSYIPPKITEKVFPMYWYLTFNFHNVWALTPTFILYNPRTGHGDTKFMDCWVTCFWGQNVTYPGDDPLVSWKSPITGEKDSYTIRRFFIIEDIIANAIGYGNIVMPKEFDADFDHSTPLVINDYPEDRAKPNHYLRRGYPGTVNTSSGDYQKPYVETPPTAEKTFHGYLQLAMRFTAEERETMFPSATYPLITAKFNFVQRYMKDTYNVDLEAIAKGPENWDITPYPELLPVIYPEFPF